MVEAVEPTDKLAKENAVELVVERLLVPMMMVEIAKELGVTPSRLTRWCVATPERAARIRNARKLSAGLWAEKAEEALLDAKDDLGLKRAKELAHHYRWKASKADPGEYGEKIEHSGSLDLRTATEDQLARELSLLGLDDVAKALLPAGAANVH